MTFESAHRTRIEEAVALTEELLPSNADEVGENPLGTSAWLPLPSRRWAVNGDKEELDEPRS